MTFLIHFTIALITLIAIVFSCILFTNAVEFLGNKLKLGNCATGSILAVLGTGLPETIVPIVAVFGVIISKIKIETAQDIALGAVLGSPFMLSTLALFFLGIILIFKKRSEKFLKVDYRFILRDYKYFLIGYLAAIIFAFQPLNQFKFIAVIFLLILYARFVYKTVITSKSVCVESECEKLIFDNNKININFSLFLQTALSILVLVVASYYFTCEIKYFSQLLNVSSAILSLIITPFATELPECVNSVIWLKQNKDDLAISNILGAIVFQTTVVFAIGIMLTPWVLAKTLLLNSILTILCCVIAILFILLFKKIKLEFLFFSGLIYFAFLIIIFIK